MDDDVVEALHQEVLDLREKSEDLKGLLIAARALDAAAADVTPDGTAEVTGPADASMASAEDAAELGADDAG